MEKKVLFGLYRSVTFTDDNLLSSSIGSFCVCASYDEDLLKHYAEVLNDADAIMSKLCPKRVRENYNVLSLSLL